jgi:hypothetical protein
MDHLACFVPGMLGLGVAAGAVGGARAARYLAAAGGVAGTCWEMYSRQPTGGVGGGGGCGSGCGGNCVCDCGWGWG